MPPRSGRDPQPKSIRIAPTDVDPLASLRIWSVQVTLDGRVWSIPKLDAAAWLMVLLDEELDPEAIFPGLAGPQAILDVNDLMMAGIVDQEDLQKAILDALEAASGRKWWVTLRLCRFLRENWDRVGGELAASGVTPFGISLSYWLDGAYATCLRLIAQGDPEHLTKFTDKLVAPPPGMAREAFDVERNANAFAAAMARAR